MDLHKEYEKIKKRNKRVELDKVWETSWTRKINKKLISKRYKL